MSAGVFTILEDFPMWGRLTVTSLCVVAFLCLHFGRDSERCWKPAYIAASVSSVLAVFVFGYAVIVGKPISLPQDTVNLNPASLWQALTDRQIQIITEELKARKTQPLYRVLYNCTDNCGVVVDGIESALDQATWREDHMPVSAPSWNLGKGIFVDQVKNDGNADALVTALQNVHLPAERKGMGGTVGSTMITIFVGEKPSL